MWLWGQVWVADQGYAEHQGDGAPYTLSNLLSILDVAPSTISLGGNDAVTISGRPSLPAPISSSKARRNAIFHMPA